MPYCKPHTTVLLLYDGAFKLNVISNIKLIKDQRASEVKKLLLLVAKDEQLSFYARHNLYIERQQR